MDVMLILRIPVGISITQLPHLGWLYTFHSDDLVLDEPRHKKTCFMLYANNKDTDELAHPRSLISAFVVAALIV